MKNQHQKRFLATVLALTGAISSFFIIKNASALTYQTGTKVQFTFNPTLSINLSSPSLTIADLAPGAASDSNIITVGVSTNAAYGYTLSATVGQKNGNSSLINNSNANYSFTNLATTAGAAASLNNFSNNYWGYSYCADTESNCNSNTSLWKSGSVGSSATGYAGLPLDNNDNTADRGLGGVVLISTTDPADAGQSVQFKIGAKASADQPAGTYTNTINFYAVTNVAPTPSPVACSSGKICYNPNSLETVQGTMGQQSASANSSVTLLASNFSLDDYGFAGWNTAPDGSGTSYGPQETITTPSSMSSGLPLYAMWVESAGIMQNWAGCSALSRGEVTALTDMRDGETYAVAKLADGKCWMIENLRLEAENTVGDNQFDSSVTNESLAQGYGKSTTYGNFAGLATAESANFDNTNPPVANTKYSPSTDGDKIVIGTGNTPYARMPRYNNINTQSRASSPTTNNASIYSYGNYYTWSAAMANTIYYNGPTATDADGQTSETVGTSLCPAGWRLPRGGNKSREATNDLWALVVTGINNGTNPANYSSSNTPYYSGSSEAGLVADKLRAYPNNFLYSGYFSTSSASSRGSYGNYWSSTAYDYYYSYHLTLYSSSVYPGTDFNRKYHGYSIRCLLGTTQAIIPEVN